MAYKILMVLSYLGIAVGVVLSFWILRGGALCFMFSIACAHIAGNQKAELQSGWTQETLFVVLSLLTQLTSKVESLEAKLDAMAPPVVASPEDTVTAELRDIRSGKSQRS